MVGRFILSSFNNTLCTWLKQVNCVIGLRSWFPSPVYFYLESWLVDEDCSLHPLQGWYVSSHPSYLQHLAFFCIPMLNSTCDRVFHFRTSLSSLIKVTDWFPRWRVSLMNIPPLLSTIISFAGEKKNSMAEPFLLFPSFNFTLLFVYISTTLK